MAASTSGCEWPRQDTAAPPEASMYSLPLASRMAMPRPLDALELAMRRYGVAAAEVALFSHATTVVTNAILEQTGARAALITTRGFRDVLELRRSARADLYDLFQDAPATLIPRRRRFEIT